MLSLPTPPTGVHIQPGTETLLLLLIWHQVVACDVQGVANEILLGVEDALAAKKRQYVQKTNLNVLIFSNEVNIVVR